MTLYEDKLDADLNWALREGSLHFEEKNQVHQALRRITERLGKLGIPHAVVGGMAMFAHGFRRFTEDVAILVTREAMNEILEKLEGLGYVQPPGTSTKLRDTQSGLPTLVELKLASGTAAHRMKDLGDVQEIIRTLKLSRDFAEQLNPYVRQKYLELWEALQQAPQDD